MHILVTVPWGHRLGGAEDMLQTMLEGAAAAGHEVDVVLLEPGPWADELARIGVHVEVIPSGRLRELGKFITTVRRLASVLRTRRPELVIAWMPKMHLYSAPAAMLAGMRDRALWWQHGIPTREWLDRCATLLPAIAVGCSSRACASAQASLRPRRPTFVVTPGSRVPEPSSSAAPISPQRNGVPTVGLVGRLQPWKGQDRLLEAQAILRGRGHESHLVLVGGDAHGLSPGYASSLPQLIERLGLDGAVTMTGQVADAGPYIEQMDVLVNASDPEPFGIVLLEAMARGVPVLAVDSGGPAEIIENGRDGVLAPSGEPQALADALEPLLSSAHLRRRIGEAGRERFMRDYTPSAVRSRFFGELGRLLSER